MERMGAYVYPLAEGAPAGKDCRERTKKIKANKKDLQKNLISYFFSIQLVYPEILIRSDFSSSQLLNVLL